MFKATAKQYFFIALLGANLSAKSGTEVNLIPKKLQITVDIQTASYLKIAGLTLDFAGTVCLVNSLNQWANSNDAEQRKRSVISGGIDLTLIIAGILLIAKSTHIANYFAPAPVVIPSK